MAALFIFLRYNGGIVFDKLDTDSKYAHYAAGNNLGQYNHGLIVVGGYAGSSFSHHSEVEGLNKEDGNLKWKKLQKYPFQSK